MNGIAIDLTNCDREPIHIPGSIHKTLSRILSLKSFMSKMDGTAFYRKLRETNKLTPFLLATGKLLTRDELLGKVLDPLFEMIGKPFDVENILRVINQLRFKTY